MITTANNRMNCFFILFFTVPIALIEYTSVYNYSRRQVYLIMSLDEVIQQHEFVSFSFDSSMKKRRLQLFFSIDLNYL